MSAAEDHERRKHARHAPSGVAVTGAGVGAGAGAAVCATDTHSAAFADTAPAVSHLAFDALSAAHVKDAFSAIAGASRQWLTSDAVARAMESRRAARVAARAAADEGGSDDADSEADSPLWMNSDAQAIVSEPYFSPQQLRRATGSLERLVDSFARLARNLARVVIAETKAGVPAARRVVPAVGDDDCVYGTKHVAESLVIVLVHDVAGVFGGHDAAVAAARHEVTNGRLLFSSGTGLACPLQVLVQALGHTCVVTAPMPVPATATRHHGMTDGGVVADPLIAQPLTAACRRLNLEPTPVAGGKTTLGASIGAYEGTDGRTYVVNTAAALPPFVPPATSQCVVIPAALGEPITVVDVPQTNGALRPALARLLGATDIVAVTAGPSDACTFLVTAVAATAPPAPPASSGGTTGAPPVPTPAGRINVRATAFLPSGTADKIRGNALLVRCEPQAWAVTHQMRPEAVGRSSTPLNADAFNPHTAHLPGAAERRGRVVAACARVREEWVPALARQLESELAEALKPVPSRGGAGAGAGAGAPTATTGAIPVAAAAKEKGGGGGGASSVFKPSPTMVSLELTSNLTQRLHDAGINVRLMGLLRSHLKSPHLRNAVLGHIIARVFKREVRAAFRAADTTADSEALANPDVDSRTLTAAVPDKVVPVANDLLAARLNLNDTPLSPAARADLKLRINAYFPGALSEAEWQTAHCVWNTLPRPCRRMCVSIAAPMSSLNIDFTTSVVHSSDDDTETAQTCVVVTGITGGEGAMEAPRLHMLTTDDDMREAIATLQARAQRVKASDGEDSIAYAAVLLDLSMVYELRATTRKQAKQLLAQAAAIATKRHGPASLLAMQARRHHAMMLLDDGLVQDAYEVATPVLAGLNTLIERFEAENLDKFPPPPPEETSVASRHLLPSYEHIDGYMMVLAAQCFMEMGRYDVVLHYLERIDKSTHSALAYAHKPLLEAHCLLRLGKPDLAYRLGRVALTLCVEQDLQRTRLHPDIHCLLSQALLSKDGSPVFESTTVFLRSTLTTDQRSEHRHSSRVALDHVTLAAYCLLVRRFASAQAHVHRARDIVLAGLGTDSVLYMAVLNVQGWLHHAKRRRQDAVGCALEIIATYDRLALSLNVNAGRLVVSAADLVWQSSSHEQRIERADAINALRRVHSATADSNGPPRVFDAGLFAECAAVLARATMPDPARDLGAYADTLRLGASRIFIEDVDPQRCAGALCTRLPTHVADSAAFREHLRATGVVPADGPVPEEVSQQLVVMTGRLGVWATVGDMKAYWQVLTADGDLAAAVCPVVSQVLRREAAAMRENLPVPITAPYCSLGLHRLNVSSYKELQRAHWSVHPTLTCSDCGVHPIIGNAAMHVAPPKYALCQHCFSVRQPGTLEKPGWLEVAIGAQPADSDDEDASHQTEAEALAERKATEEADAETARVCPGTTALHKHYDRLYPDDPQDALLQITALQKFHEGGPDPLDCVRVFKHPGDAVAGSPPHWHYLSLGFSDLYGDGRIFPPVSDASTQTSGFGFELSFRVKRGKDDASPPTWPARVMNSLARYLHKVKTTFSASDTISGSLSEYLPDTPHTVLTVERTLPTLFGPTGVVEFYQIVPFCEDELQAAQLWSSQGITRMLSEWRHDDGGGPGDLLVADPARVGSIFTHDPATYTQMLSAVDREGSRGEGCVCSLAWEALPAPPPPQGDEPAVPGGAPGAPAERVVESATVHTTLKFAKRLGYALRGRLAHGKSFHFKTYGAQNVVLVAEGGAEEYQPKPHPVAADATRRFVVAGGRTLTVFVPAATALSISRDILEACAAHSSGGLPFVLEWAELPGLRVTVQDDRVFAGPR